MGIKYLANYMSVLSLQYLILMLVLHTSEFQNLYRVDSRIAMCQLLKSLIFMSGMGTLIYFVLMYIDILSGEFKWWVGF